MDGLSLDCAFKSGQSPVHTADPQKQRALPSQLAFVLVTSVPVLVVLASFTSTAFTWLLAIFQSCILSLFYFGPSFIDPDYTCLLIVSATSSNHLPKKIPTTNFTHIPDMSIYPCCQPPNIFSLCLCMGQSVFVLFETYHSIMELRV